MNQEFVKFLDWNIFKKQNLINERKEIEKLRQTTNQYSLHHKASKSATTRSETNNKINKKN